MNNLPMPSEVRALLAKESAEAAQKSRGKAEASVIEPPSVKLILRLFIIPLLIAAAVASREKVLETLMKCFDAQDVSARKAAILALAFWQGQEESRKAIPALIRKLGSADEDVDVRMAAATTLGNIASGNDAEVVEALKQAMNETDAQKAELVWNAASALARLGREEAVPTM